MVRTRAGFAVCSNGVGLHVPVHSGPFPVCSSSRAGLLAGSERSGIGGLLHVAGVSRENVGYRVYTAQGILERISVNQGLPQTAQMAGIQTSVSVESAVGGCYKVTPIFFSFTLLYFVDSFLVM